MNVQIEADWKAVLKSELGKEYFTELIDEVNSLYLSGVVYPSQELIFNAFTYCPFTKVKVVILGQDPYHGFGQAHGLAFSVPDEIKIPPSLMNIYKEIGNSLPLSGNLVPWAEQGVLLLNSTLTVTAHQPGSHQKLGWETFTDAVISKVSDKQKHVVFLLWGAFAQKKEGLIDHTKHLVLTAPHPSPLSAHRGFLGCGHFRKANEYLEKHKRAGITW